MGKFDMAIQYLRASFGISANEEEAAIRVLEAAGKVDGSVAVKVWDWLHSDSAICPPWVNQENSLAIRTLLAALPDKEDE